MLQRHRWWAHHRLPARCCARLHSAAPVQCRLRIRMTFSGPCVCAWPATTSDGCQEVGARLHHSALRVHSGDVFGAPSLVGGNLRRRRAAHSQVGQLLLDIFAPARKYHHLLAAVAFELPAPVRAAMLHAVASSWTSRASSARVLRWRTIGGRIFDPASSERHTPRPLRKVHNHDVGWSTRIRGHSHQRQWRRDAPRYD